MTLTLTLTFLSHLNQLYIFVRPIAMFSSACDYLELFGLVYHQDFGKT